MDSAFCCPACGKPLLAYESFFACTDFHRVEKDCRRNLIFPGKNDYFLSAADAEGIRALISKKPFAFLGSEMLNSLQGFGVSRGMLLFSPMVDDTICERAARSFPAARVIALCRSKSRIRTLHSGENLLYAHAPEQALQSSFFDAVVSCENTGERAEALLREGGIFLQILPGEKFAREIVCYGFPEGRNASAGSDGLRLRERYQIARRIFFSSREAQSLYQIMVPGKKVPETLSGFPGGFVTLQFTVSCFERKKQIQNN